MQAGHAETVRAVRAARSENLRLKLDTSSLSQLIRLFRAWVQNIDARQIELERRIEKLERERDAHRPED